MGFHVAGALELLEDHLVHLGAGVHQGGGDDGQAAAFLDVTRGTEEALGLFQGVGVDTAGQHLAGGRHHGVVGARQTGDGIEQDDHVLLVLDQALGLLDHHLGHLDVTRRRLVEGRGDHFAAHGARHLGDLLGALVDQQHDQLALGIVARDRGGDVLQHQRLARLGRRHDQATLTLADGRGQVDDARGQILGGTVADLHAQTVLRKQRREVLEQDLVLGVLRPVQVDLADLQQREVALAFFRRANLAGDGVALAQVEAPDLGRRHIDIVGAGQVGAVGAAQESETVLKDLQHAIAEDVFAALGVLLQDGKDDVLLAGPGQVVDTHLAGDIEKLRHGLLLEFGQIHQSSEITRGSRAARRRGAKRHAD